MSRLKKIVFFQVNDATVTLNISFYGIEKGFYANSAPTKRDISARCYFTKTNMVVKNETHTSPLRCDYVFMVNTV